MCVCVCVCVCDQPISLKGVHFTDNNEKKKKKKDNVKWFSLNLRLLGVIYYSFFPFFEIFRNRKSHAEKTMPVDWLDSFIYLFILFKLFDWREAEKFLLKKVIRASWNQN